MNNEIALRTSKGEYLPGSTVYGAVYLHICRPTEATGIKLSLKGIEVCEFEYESEEEKKLLRSETVHVDFSGVSLYSQTEFFQFGDYVFPFKFELPKEIPGTFQCKGESGSNVWKASVTYTMEAHAVGADAIQVTLPLVVYQAEEIELEESALGTAHDKSFDVSRFPWSKKLHLTVKLLNNFVETGSNLQLRLIVTNTSKVSVTGFSVKLLRHLKLTLRANTVTDKKGIANMCFNDEMAEVLPEGGPHLVRWISGSSSAIMFGNSGLDRLQIPLVEEAATDAGKEKMNVPATVMGKHIKWRQWEAPPWTFQAQPMFSTSLFSVSQQVLRTEAFSGLPSFQVL